MSDPPVLHESKSSSWLAFWLRPKVALPILLVVLALLSPVLIRAWHLRGIPNVGEPFDISELEQIEVPDEENAWVDYYEATRMYVDVFHWDDDFDTSFHQVQELGWVKAIPEIEKWVNDNDRALEKWMEGSKKNDALSNSTIEIVHPGTTPEPEESGRLAYNRDEENWVRDFSRLLMMKANQAHHLDGPEAAWKWNLCNLRSGLHLTRHGTVLQTIGGYGVISWTNEAIYRWSTDSALTKDQLLQARSDVEEAWKMLGSMGESVQWEYLWHKQDYVNFFDDPDELTSSARLHRYMQGYPETFLWLIQISYVNRRQYTDKTFIELPSQSGKFDLFVDNSDRLMGVPELTVSQYDELANRVRVQSSGFDMDIDVNDVADGAILQEARDRSICFYEMLRLGLALQAYHRENQRFPKELDGLVTEFIGEIPIDLFDGNPMKYRLDPQGAIVYSVYTDQIDDGGVYYSADQREEKPGFSGNPPDRGVLIHTPFVRPHVAPRSVE